MVIFCCHFSFDEKNKSDTETRQGKYIESEVQAPVKGDFFLYVGEF